jgi:hypothetical protein
MNTSTNQTASARPAGKNALLALAIVFCAILGCKMGAKGRVAKPFVQPNTKIVNGELDYGYNCVVSVKNVGATGTIKINVTMSTSEGEWEREQNLNYNAGEEQVLEYFFAEPTITAAQPQCQVRVSPQER